MKIAGDDLVEALKIVNGQRRERPKQSVPLPFRLGRADQYRKHCAVRKA